MKRFAALLALALMAIAAGAQHARGQIPAAGFGGFTPANVLSVTSIGNVSTAGGTTTLTGAGFSTVSGATPQVGICLSPCDGHQWDFYSVTVTNVVNSTQLTVVAKSGIAAGTYDVLVDNLGGGISSPAVGAFSVSATSDFSTVFTTNLGAWWREDSGISCGGGACSNGGSADTWLDKTTNHCDLTASGTARPTFNAVANSVFNATASRQSLTFDGAANILNNTACTFDTQKNALFIVLREITPSSGTQRDYIALNDATTVTLALGSQTANTPDVGNASVIQNWNTTVSSGFQMYGYADSTAPTLHVSVANGTAQTNANGGSFASSSLKVAIGAFPDSTRFANFEVVEAAVVKGHVPTQSELNLIGDYLNLRYFDYQPGYSSAFATCTTSSGFRLAGPGGAQQFVPGVTVTFSNACAPLGTVTPTFKSSTVLDVVLSGTTVPVSDLTHHCTGTINNPDGGTTTISDIVTIKDNSVAANYDPTVVTCDLSTTLWIDAAHVATSGSPCPGASCKITSFTNRALLSNTPSQGTSADQAVQAADTAYHGATYASGWDGTAVGYIISTFDQEATTPTFDMIAVAVPDAANTNNGTFFSFSISPNNPGSKLGILNGKPITVSRANIGETWGSNVGGSEHEFFGDISGSSSPASALNVDNGTQITGSTSGVALTNNQVAGVGENGNATSIYKGTMAAVVVWNRTLTSTEQAHMFTWYQNNF